MRGQRLAIAVAMAASIGTIAHARAEGTTTSPEHAAEEHKEYASRGIYEIGGNVAFNWTTDVYSIEGSPQVGYFVADHIEISLILGLLYTNEKQPDGSRNGTTVFTALVEPSYHIPMKKERLYAFGGIGLGIGYDGNSTEFDIVPRAGLEYLLGNSVITVALKVPITTGDGTDVGFGITIGIATSL